MRRLIGQWLDGEPLVIHVDASYKLRERGGFVPLTLPDGSRGLLNANAVAYVRVEEILSEEDSGA